MRKIYTLDDSKLRKAKALKPGTMLADGNGLYAKVREGGGIYFCFRFSLNKRHRVMGLGPYCPLPPN